MTLSDAEKIRQIHEMFHCEHDHYEADAMATTFPVRRIDVENEGGRVRIQLGQPLGMARTVEPLRAGDWILLRPEPYAFQIIAVGEGVITVCTEDVTEDEVDALWRTQQIEHPAIEYCPAAHC